MTLEEQLAQAIAEARKALEAGEIEKGKEYRKKAETVAEAIKELKALDGMDRPDPLRPVLPGAGPVAGDATKAAYVMRFGDPDAATKAILIDLHGPDYQQKYLDQRHAFSYFLRSDPRTAVPDWVSKAMREIVLTPKYVKDAMDQGIDVAAMKTVMVEGSDALGGYIVPVDFQARVISRAAAVAVVRPRAAVIPTSRDSVEMPVLTGGDAQYPDAIRITWVDETPTAGTAATNFTWGSEKIPVHTMMAEAFLSRNLVEDAAFPLEARLADSFGRAVAVNEDNQFISGDGHAKPQGLLPDGANDLSISEVVSGSASALTWDGLVSLTFGIDAQYRSAAVWIGEKATYEAIAKLKDGMNQYLWREVWGNNVGGGGAGTIRNLLGYPILEQEAMATIGSNTYPLIFGDLGGYTVVDRIGMSVERYLDSATARLNQVCFVMRRRLGGQCTETWRFAVQKCST